MKILNCERIFFHLHTQNILNKCVCAHDRVCVFYIIWRDDSNSRTVNNSGVTKWSN